MIILSSVLKCNHIDLCAQYLYSKRRIAAAAKQKSPSEQLLNQQKQQTLTKEDDDDDDDAADEAVNEVITKLRSSSATDVSCESLQQFFFR